MQSTDDLKVKLGAILRALNIARVEYSLSGGGDSGETTLESVTDRSGAIAQDLPNVPVTVTNGGTLIKLPDLLERVVSDAPDGDWINNEGGYGSVTVLPFEQQVGLIIECDMTFGDDDEDEEDFDDECDGNREDWDAEPSSPSLTAPLLGEELK